MGAIIFFFFLPITKTLTLKRVISKTKQKQDHKHLNAPSPLAEEIFCFVEKYTSTTLFPWDEPQ